jgi:hypothetical protein
VDTQNRASTEQKARVSKDSWFLCALPYLLEALDIIALRLQNLVLNVPAQKPRMVTKKPLHRLRFKALTSSSC